MPRSRGLPSVDEQYARLLRQLLRAPRVEGRNGATRRLTTFPRMDLDRFPLITLRRTAWRTALREMEFFMSGSDRIGDMHPSVRPWWEPHAVGGRLPNSYGVQLRDFHGRHGSVDQVESLIQGIVSHPNGRRHVITTWNTADMLHPTTPITNCHGSLVQVLREGGTLHMLMVQRSQDVICGMPHNLVQYWALLLWLCHRTGTVPGRFTWQGGDVHLYEPHEALARRIAAQRTIRSPDLRYAPTSEAFLADDFSLTAPYAFSLEERADPVT